jgi:DNA repair protein RecO (recombination protein O)
VVDFHAEVIVLSQRDFREADALVTLFAREQGKQRAVARGLKKPSSSLRPCLQPFCHSRLHVRRGRELGLVTQGRALNFFPDLREDIEATAMAAYLMELVEKGLEEADPHPRLFDDLLQVLQHLECRAAAAPLLLRWFELRLAAETGYRPHLQECADCGTGRPGKHFSVSQGGLLCDRCAGAAAGTLSLDGESCALLLALGGARPDTVLRLRASARAQALLEEVLGRHLEYHLDRRFVFRQLLRSLRAPGAGSGRRPAAD